MGTRALSLVPGDQSEHREGGRDSLAAHEGSCSRFPVVLPDVWGAPKAGLADYSCPNSCLPKLYLSNQNKAVHGSDMTKTDATRQVRKQHKTILSPEAL